MAVSNIYGYSSDTSDLPQSARNYHAMLAARALGRLSGLLQGKPGSPCCDAAAAALSALLTPALAAKLAAPDPKPLLMHLNSSLLNPQVREAATLILCLVQLLNASSTAIACCGKPGGRSWLCRWCMRSAGCVALRPPANSQKYPCLCILDTGSREQTSVSLALA